MSAAKPTPRYVERIRPNIGLVGPTTEAQVIPIRRVTPAYVPEIAPPATPVQRPRRVVAPTVPVARRPWQLLLVPPSPDRSTKTVTVARWQARLVVISLSLLLLLSGGAIATIVVAVQNPDYLTAPEDAALLRTQVAEMEDSLSSVRDDLEESEVAQDSLTELLTKATRSSGAVRARPVARPRVRKSARVHALPDESLGSDDEGMAVAVGERSVEGLPVLGRIASGFSRSRRHPILHIRRPHLGVDVAAPTGTPVTAPAAGRVRFVGRKFGFGLVVEIQHPNRIVTRYAHLKKATVAVGDQIERGALIATVGRSGITTGPHLHYEVLVHGRQVDPLRFRMPQPNESEAAAPSPAPSASGMSVTGGAPAAPPALSHDAISSIQLAPAPR
jgi:murein DD-endopeptidase MepM/ murein hydrolase activator NlpD